MLYNMYLDHLGLGYNYFNVLNVLLRLGRIGTDYKSGFSRIPNQAVDQLLDIRCGQLFGLWLVDRLEKQ